jgi:phosphoribosylformylglycinamidine synthase
VGLLDDWKKSATIAFKAEGLAIYVLGGPTPHFYDWASDANGVPVPKTHGPQVPSGHLGQSLWLSEIHGRREGGPPPVDLKKERQVCDFVRQHIAAGTIRACHDVSDGGILVALAEMALAGAIGAEILFDNPAAGLAAAAFGEDQGRFIIAVDADPSGNLQGVGFHAEAINAGVECWALGVTGGDALRIEASDEGGRGEVPLAGLRAAHEGFFPALMQGEL